jgi:hypothetical protein
MYTLLLQITKAENNRLGIARKTFSLSYSFGCFVMPHQKIPVIKKMHSRMSMKNIEQDRQGKNYLIWLDHIREL